MVAHLWPDRAVRSLALSVWKGRVGMSGESREQVHHCTDHSAISARLATEGYGTMVVMSRYDRIDRDAVIAELESFVRQTEPVRGHGTFVAEPRCGFDGAKALEERVRPILDALYPEWRAENSESSYEVSAQERSACTRLISRLRNSDGISELLRGVDSAPRFAASSLHELVWRAAAPQWELDHRHDAVLAAAKAVNSLLQRKLGRRDVSEVKLVQEAFSEKPPSADRARLRFDDVGDDQTKESLREGVMSFGVGCFKAIRHPLGHRPEEEIELGEQAALERLAALSLLARWIDEASLVTRDS